MARRPNAPALTHNAASSLILLTKTPVDGVAALNTQSLRCFHVIQGISSVAEASPLCIGLAVHCLALLHHSVRFSSPSGTRQVRRSHESISNHTCLEKGHPNSKCWIDSDAWSQSGQQGGCGSPLRARRSAVQQRPRFASQWKNFTRGGAQAFQVSFQAGQEVEPWKVAR